MTITTYIVPVMIAIVMATIVILLVIRANNVKLIRSIATSSAALTMIPTLFLFIKRVVFEDELYLSWSAGTWIRSLLHQSGEAYVSIPLSLHIDIFIAWMLLIINVITLTIVLNGHYIKTRQKWYYIGSLLLYFISLFILLSENAWVLLAAISLMSVVIFFMAGIWSKASDFQFATRFIFLQSIGFSCIAISMFILQFIVLNSNEQQLILMQVQSNMETYTYMNISQVGYRNLALLFLLIGFMFLMPLIGFHRAIRDLFTNVNYPILISVVGLYLPLMAYMFKQYLSSFFIDYVSSIQPFVMTICVLQIGYMAIHLWRVKKTKDWSGYLALASIPIVYILLVSELLVTLSFALLAIVSFMLTMTLLLSVFASLQERHEDNSLEQLKSLFSLYPSLASMIVLTLLAASGLPLFSHYFTIFHAFYAVYDFNGFVFLLCIVSVFLVAINVFLHMSKLFIKNDEIAVNNREKDLRFSELIPNIMLIAFIFMLGIYPAVFLQRIELYIDQLLNSITQYDDVIIWDTDFYFSLIIGDSIRTTIQFGVAALVVVLLLAMCWLGSRQNQKMIHWVYGQASYFTCIGLTIVVMANNIQIGQLWKQIIFYGGSVSLIFVGTHFLLSRHMYRSRYEDAVHYEGLYYKNTFLFSTMSILLLSIIGLPFSPISMMRFEFVAQLMNARYVLLALVVCLSYAFILRPIWHWLATITFPVTKGSLLNRHEQIEDWKWTTVEKRLVIGVICTNLILYVIYILL